MQQRAQECRSNKKAINCIGMMPPRGPQAGYNTNEKDAWKVEALSAARSDMMVFKGGQ
jgi:hypothetical protein